MNRALIVLMTPTIHPLVDVWHHIGFRSQLVIFVLFLMSLAALSVLIERGWAYVTLHPFAEVEAARRAARSEGFDRNAQRRAMERSMRANRHELARGVRNLLTIGLTAPLVGLAGMISGLMNAFRTAALTGDERIGTLSTSIAEALVPFAIGLAVSLVAIWGHAYLRRRLEEITAGMRRFAMSVEALADGELLQ